MDLLYTQATGFSQYQGTLMQDVSELSKVTDYDEQIRAAGYVRQWEYIEGDEYDGDRVIGYEIEGENQYGLPRFLVTYWDESRGHHIHCNGPGDFFALRLELIRTHQVVSPQINALYQLARKAFQAIHGHDGLDICNRCHPRNLRENEL